MRLPIDEAAPFYGAPLKIAILDIIRGQQDQIGITQLLIILLKNRGLDPNRIDEREKKNLRSRIWRTVEVLERAELIETRLQVIKSYKKVINAK